MKKRILLIAGGLLVGILLIMFLIPKRPPIQVEKIIPSEPLMYISVNNLDEIFFAMRKSNFYKSLKEFLESESYINKNEIEKVLSHLGKKTILAIYYNDNKTTSAHLLWAIEIQNSSLLWNILKRLPVQKHKYKGVDVKTIKINDSRKSRELNFFFLKKYLLISNSEKLLKKCINLYKEKKIEKSLYFSKFFKEYLSKKEKPKIFGIFDTRSLKKLKTSSPQPFPLSTSRTYFEIHNLKGNVFCMKKISQLNSLLKESFKTLFPAPTKGFACLELIPKDISSLIIFSLNWKKLFSFSQTLPFPLDKKMKETLGYSATEILNTFGNEGGFLFFKFTNLNSFPFLPQGGFFIEVKDKKRAENIFKNIISWWTQQSQEKKTFKIETTLFSYKGFDVNNIKIIFLSKPHSFSLKIEYFFIKNLLFIGIGEFYPKLIDTLHNSAQNILTETHFSTFFKKDLNPIGITYLNYLNLEKVFNDFFSNLEMLIGFGGGEILRNFKIFFTTLLKLSDFYFGEVYFKQNSLQSTAYFNLKDLSSSEWKEFFVAIKEISLLSEKYKNLPMRKKKSLKLKKPSN